MLPVVAAAAAREAVEQAQGETLRQLEEARALNQELANQLEQAGKEREDQKRHHEEELSRLRRERRTTLGTRRCGMCCRRRGDHPGNRDLREFAMTMNSLSLMPGLLELPSEPGNDRQSTKGHLEALFHTDGAMYAAEQSSATAAGFWTLFDTVNVDDTIARAYEAAYPNVAAEHSLHERWLEMMDRGERSMTGFISGVKGKVAEFSAADQLREVGMDRR